MKIEVSNGEVIDKLIILQIKLEEIKDEKKLTNLRKEWEELKTVSSTIIPEEDLLFKALYQVNKELWDIENRIRDHERKQDFSNDFIKLARSVYIKNDERFEIKRKINQQTSSHLSEEKSYDTY